MPTIAGQNFPGEWEVEIKYTVDGMQHSQKLNCNVQGAPVIGDAANTITLDTRDGVGVLLDAAVTAWVDLIKTQYEACG